MKLYKWQTVGLTVGSLAPNLMALKGVCPDPNEWTTFVNSVKTLVEEYEDVVELEHLGLSDGWFRRLVAARPK